MIFGLEGHQRSLEVIRNKKNSVINEVKTQKQRIFKKHIWQFYSSLNYLSNGTQFVKLLSFIIFTIFYVQDPTCENLENIKNYERKT